MGRIHEAIHAKNAIGQAQKAGFKRINIDLMFGLPNQTIEDALFDLQTAIDLSPTHLSWYQLTLEPNTYFHRFPPALPDDDYRFDIQKAGQRLLMENSFPQYEISAYSQDPCRHNKNYWLFGDYLAIGAGAHAKFTNQETMCITRRWNTKHPKQYLNDFSFETKIISQNELPLEFMMNALRLREPISIALFEERTGLSIASIKKPLEKAIEVELLTCNKKSFQITEKGYLFLNELLELFMS